MLLFTYCSPTETVTEEPVIGDVEIEEMKPGWFDSKVVSREDSLSFYGYSHSSAADSSEAIELSTQMALENIRFEIDRHADETRESALKSTGADRYNSTEFIVQLRNIVQNINLSGAVFEYDLYQSEGDTYHVFSKAKLEKQQVMNEIASALQDEGFAAHLSI